MFSAAAREGLRGVVSFADPVVRRAADGRLVIPGHRGVAYQAKGAVALGRLRAETALVLPDGTSLDRRALSKLRRDECGHGYVERRVVAFGAPRRRFGESGQDYLARALPAAGVLALRHGGCYRYAFRLGTTRAERATVRIGLPASPYPKAIDDTSWRQATPVTMRLDCTRDMPTLM
jgi:hypothetical protein